MSSLWRSAWHGADLITADPIGVLLPSSLSLLLQAWAVWVTVRTATLDPATWAWSAVAWCAWWLLSVPLRRRSLVAAGAELELAPVRGQGMAFLGLHLLLGVPRALAFLVGLTVGVWPAVQLTVAGWPAPALVALAGGSLLGAGLAALVRGTLGYAPAEVLFGGRSAVAAIGASVRRPLADVLAGIALVVLGDAAVLLGSLACGAGALPGYPWSDLGLLHRWAAPRARGGPSL